MEAAEVLRKPYARLVLPHPDGAYTAEIAEFPGCIAVGSSAEEALATLEEVATDWIKVALKQGQDIPEPMEAAAYSGKLVLRMPKALHKRAAFWAQRNGVSLNQFIVTCIAEHVGERSVSNRQIVIGSQFAQILNLAMVGDSSTGTTPTEAWARNFPQITLNSWGQNA